MPFSKFLHTRRRIVSAGSAFAVLVTLGLGAHAARNARHEQPARHAVVTPDHAATPTSADRLALIIGNSAYPDADAPLAQPVNDARALAAQLRGQGYDVQEAENATRAETEAAIARIERKITPQSVVVIYFAGYGVQSGSDNFMIPVDAAIWKERDVRRSGINITAMLKGFQHKGARANVAVIDASRRNPYERRYRNYSRGLAPIEAAKNTIVVSSAAPGSVLDDANGKHSLLMETLLAQLGSNGENAEAMFASIRSEVSGKTDGQQLLSITSTLPDDIKIASEHLAEKRS